MKIFFTVFLVLNLLFEGMAAVFLIGGPGGIRADVMPETGMWAMNYGFAAFAIASAIVWMWPYRTDLGAVSVGLGVLMTFHIALSISLHIPGNQMGPAILHTVMAIMAVVLYSQRRKWCAPETGA